VSGGIRKWVDENRISQLTWIKYIRFKSMDEPLEHLEQITSDVSLSAYKITSTVLTGNVSQLS